MIHWFIFYIYKFFRPQWPPTFPKNRWGSLHRSLLRIPAPSPPHPENMVEHCFIVFQVFWMFYSKAIFGYHIWYKSFVSDLKFGHTPIKSISISLLNLQGSPTLGLQPQISLWLFFKVMLKRENKWFHWYKNLIIHKINNCPKIILTYWSNLKAYWEYWTTIFQEKRNNSNKIL